ncbi:hypothetical protein T439DRAFT_181244 [Meredithblackwellia eburnea MCA 4105]
MDTESYKYAPCAPCRSRRCRCEGASHQRRFPCLSCTKRRIQMTEGLDKERSSSASPSGVPTRLAQSQMTLALTYHLLQEARSTPTPRFFQPPVLAWRPSLNPLEKSSPLSRLRTISKTFNFERFKNYPNYQKMADLHTAFALALGARRSMHSAIMGNNKSPRPTLKNLNTGGVARLDAVRNLSEKRDALAESVRHAALAGENFPLLAEEYPMWMNLLRMKCSSADDADSPYHPVVLPMVDGLRLMALSTSTDKEEKRRLEREAGLIRILDVTQCLKTQQQLLLSDEYLATTHQWTETAARGRLKQFLSSTEELSSFHGDEELAMLSSDATVVILRGAAKARNQDSIPAIRRLLALLQMGDRVRLESPRLWHCARDDGSTFGREHCQFVGRARILLGELVTCLDPETVAGGLVEEVEMAMESQRLVMLHGIVEDLLWIDSLTVSESISTFEAEALASWASYRLREGVVDVAVENVRRMVSNVDHHHPNHLCIDPSFGLAQLKLLLAALRGGSFVSPVLGEEASKLKVVVDELSAVQELNEQSWATSTPLSPAEEADLALQAKSMVNGALGCVDCRG